MELIDTHTHQYAEQFDEDLEASIQRAKAAGITKMLLPNIELDSLDRMLNLHNAHPEMCLPMYGLHPCYVKDDWKAKLAIIQQAYETHKDKCVAVGEIGIDLYWDKTHYNEQVVAFQTQVEWALEQDLPIAIHARNSYKELIAALEPYKDAGVRGVFHCFAGGKKHVNRINELGDFYYGLGGTITFNAEGMKSVLKLIPLERIILETDAPYLAPEPHRGERNESAHLPYVAQKLAELKGVSEQEIASITTENAQRLFKLS